MEDQKKDSKNILSADEAMKEAKDKEYDILHNSMKNAESSKNDAINSSEYLISNAMSPQPAPLTNYDEIVKKALESEEDPES